MKQKPNKKLLKHIILVGVAGVGKTTIGRIAAEKLEMQFVDIDMSFENAEEADIDTLLERYGEREFDRRMLSHFSNVVCGTQHTIFAAPARITQYKEFWKITNSNGISIHLCGDPMGVYMRQEMWVDGSLLTKEEKLKDRYKREFYRYYNWRIKKCQKADYTVYIEGDKQRDTGRLCEKITEILLKNY